MREAVLAHVQAHRPVLAECGGLMYLGRTIETTAGERHPMVGALALDTVMHKSLQAIGHYQVTLSEGQLRGHGFHYSRLAAAPSTMITAAPLRWGPEEPILREKRTLASYVHWYFPSNPVAVSRLLSV